MDPSLFIRDHEFNYYNIIVDLYIGYKYKNKLSIIY